MANRKRAIKENTTKSTELIQPSVQLPAATSSPPADNRAAAVEAAFRKGEEEGYNRAKQEFLKELSYNKGALNVITIAENYLAETLGLKSRQDLAKCDKVPSWWIITLMSDIWYKNP